MSEAQAFDLSDLAAPDAATNPKRAKATEKPQSVALVQFWDRWTCICGASYDGPRAGYHPAYIKRKLPRGQGYDFQPVTPGTTIPSGLDRIVESHEEIIYLCPWCAETTTQIPDRPALSPRDQKPRPLSNEAEEEVEEEEGPQTVSDLADILTDEEA